MAAVSVKIEAKKSGGWPGEGEKKKIHYARNTTPRKTAM